MISAYANTREIAPIVAGVGLAAQVGCGFTAQLGAMRISEEVDALEVMAVPSLPYLVSTRILAAFTAVMPLYLVGLFASYVATEVEVVYLNHQSKGTYLYYFHRFLPVEELFYSLRQGGVRSRSSSRWCTATTATPRPVGRRASAARRGGRFGRASSRSSSSTWC